MSETTTLTTVATEWEAALIVESLEEGGIRAEAAGAFTSGFRAETPGRVKVIVRTEDVERARVALAGLREKVASIDWDKVDLGEAIE